MSFLYLACLLITVGMLFWMKLFDVRNSTNQLITLLVVAISSIGFYFVSISKTIEEAVMAQKISYVGGIFLPLFFFLLVLEICHVKIRSIISIMLIVVQCVLFGFVCTIGKTEWFYKSVSSYTKNGVAVLNKVYGPVHTIYLITLLGYLVAAICISVYSLSSKKSLNKKGIFFIVTFAMIAIAAYIVEKVIHLEYEIMPVVYVFLVFGTMIPLYDYNIYTVYENKDIIEEQLDRIGFLTFDKKRIYKGCDTFMERVFPELTNYEYGQKIVNCSPELQSLINQISSIEEAYKQKNQKGHIHTPLTPFLVGDRQYDGEIHIVTNAFGKFKGYTIEIHDTTEHYNALRLQEHYNEELSTEVRVKTKRIRSIQQKTLIGIARMVESRDLSTGGHIKRTSDVVRIFAKKLAKEKMGLDYEFLELVIRSAPMHDIGKIGVDDAVLRKQGRFTDDEYAAMKKHSEIGYHMVSEILSDVEEPEFVAVAENVAHYHHEKVNGTGYPMGLKSDEIPVEARIMALADVFDALVSKRCYKDAFSYDDAFAIIEKDSGTHFDADLAKVFMTCRPELEDYYNKNSEL